MWEPTWVEPEPKPAASNGTGMIPAMTQASWASLMLWVSSDCWEGSPPYGPSSEIGMIILVALGFQRWSNMVGGLPGTLLLESRQDRQAQVEPGPQNSL